MHATVRIAFVVLVAVLVAGCSKSSGATTCDAIGARFLAIAEADLAAEKGVGRDERDAVHGLLAPLRDAIVKACRQDGWSADARACYVAAPDEARFRACEAKLSGEQRALLEQSAAKGIQPR